jgi:hypothetical protein
VGATKFNWRILSTLSNIAAVVLGVVWILDWYHWSGLEESVMDNPAARSVWLREQHLYTRIGLVAAAFMIGSKIAYWVIEYLHDRRMTTNKGG